jgi:basic membrane protein A|tara:strand:+ start:238 stop:1338 length:1101 start_codon:yes stop_codon:yes gene_type:complete
MKSKWLVLFIVFGLILTACGGSDTAEETVEEAEEAPQESLDSPATTAAPAEPAPPTASVGVVYDIGGRGDLSFNDMAYAGLEKAIADLGVDGIDLEPNEGGENRPELLTLLADEGKDLIIGVGFLFADAMTEVATAYPDTSFGIIDSAVEPANVSGMVFAEEQGSFLVGVAAGLKTTTNKIGFIGGVEFPLIQKFEAGFAAGVAAACPTCTVDVKYVTYPPDFGGFNDAAKAKEIALAQYEEGADIIYHAAGGAGNGLFEAAKEVSDSTGTKVWAIGVDADQANTVSSELAPYILTSMIKRVDVAVYNTIKAVVDGTFAGGVTVFDLSVDGVGYSTTGGWIDDIVSDIEGYKAQIISGEITVPAAP